MIQKSRNVQDHLYTHTELKHTCTDHTMHNKKLYNASNQVPGSVRHGSIVLALGFLWCHELPEASALVGVYKEELWNTCIEIIAVLCEEYPEDCKDWSTSHL